MGFTLNPGLVRGDLFKPQGKWKYTVAIDMTQFYDTPLIHDAVLEAYAATPESVRGVVDGATGLVLVVLEPYHIHSHPISVTI